MDRIVILMATYQGEKYLGEQLDSIVAQDYPDWELIVRDDGSTDRTIEILKAYREQYPDRITVCRNKENLGGTKNFLTLLKEGAALGREREKEGVQTYFMFSDQDDFWYKDKLRCTLLRMKQVEARYGGQVPALVFTDARVVDGGRKEISSSFFALQHFHLHRRTLSHLLMENMVIGCTSMMNAALANLVEKVPKHARYHDWWMALLAAATGHTSYLPKATLDYRQHGDNVVGTQDFAAYVKQRACALSGLKESLAANFCQAEEFYQIYREKIPLDAAVRIKDFLHLRERGGFACRVMALRGGYLKSGLLRNVGLFLIL